MNILVYTGPGTSNGSVRHTLRTLKAFLSSSYDIIPVDHSILNAIPCHWAESTALLVMPGGRDLPYVEFLSPRGIESITKYVNAGGKYLGFCAGAYFACSEIDFSTHLYSEYSPLENNKENIASVTETTSNDTCRIKGKRDLNFFPGRALGSITPDFTYNSEKGARAITLKLDKSLECGHSISAYVNGGPFFEKYPTASSMVNTLGWYITPRKELKSAIVECTVGRGKALLCGPHIEYDSQVISQHLHEVQVDCEARAYLEDILPTLLKSEESRMTLVKRLLLRLDLKVNEIIDAEDTPKHSPLFLIPLVEDVERELLDASLSLKETSPIVDSFNTWQMMSSKAFETLKEEQKQNSSKETTEKKTDILQILQCDLKEAFRNIQGFDIKQYAQEWKKSRNQRSLSVSKSLNNNGFGSLIMYGETVSSTQTILEK